jgi:hypothetical protein
MKVYLTRRNSDMTEGRGPMVNDKCFINRELAAEHIDNKPGVMGRAGKWSEQEHGDWQVQEIDVLKFSVRVSEQEKENLVSAGLAKLTQEEKEAMGF